MTTQTHTSAHEGDWGQNNPTVKKKKRKKAQYQTDKHNMERQENGFGGSVYHLGRLQPQDAASFGTRGGEFTRGKSGGQDSSTFQPSHTNYISLCNRDVLKPGGEYTLLRVGKSFWGQRFLMFFYLPSLRLWQSRYLMTKHSDLV